MNKESLDVKTGHNAIGEKLRMARKAKGLTQQELAKLLNVPQAYVSSIERGDTHLKETVIVVHGPRDTTVKMVALLKINIG